ncbi:UNVERIFIED_CONTAM: DNA-directed RNA polymerase I subunit [Sesamum radiatum]|uniref:DNA-directed RNA polymerase n=1 Tax=Sesamum radiatum TaxID=300843 RepID=A0AAW2KCH1_SESRA
MPGLQVITALLNHITRGCAPCTVKNQGKVPKNYFAGSSYKNGEEDEDQNAEHNLLIWKNELVRGVIDKAQFGKFGLIHGFTCGVDDLIILPHYDVQRKEKLEGEDVGEEVHCDFVKFKPGQIVQLVEGIIPEVCINSSRFCCTSDGIRDTRELAKHIPLVPSPEELQLEIEKVICGDRESATAALDMKMKNKLTNRLTREGSQILKHLLTAGLLKPFPKNFISVMTTTGAKGSTSLFPAGDALSGCFQYALWLQTSVHLLQWSIVVAIVISSIWTGELSTISAYLGQQELEGKRVPRMVLGRLCPAFHPGISRLEQEALSLIAF